MSPTGHRHASIHPHRHLPIRAPAPGSLIATQLWSARKIFPIAITLAQVPLWAVSQYQRLTHSRPAVINGFVSTTAVVAKNQ